RRPADPERLPQPGLDERHGGPGRRANARVRLSLRGGGAPPDGLRRDHLQLVAAGVSGGPGEAPDAPGRPPLPRPLTEPRRRDRGGGAARGLVSQRLLTLSLRDESDIVVARQRARQLARLLGFDSQDQVRIATAVSEIARNAVQYAGGGRLEFQLEGRSPPQLLAMSLHDSGPGIAELDAILAGRYRSEPGMGLGLAGARRLMDQFRVQSSPGKGTSVHLGKLLPRGSPALEGAALGAVAAAMAAEQVQNPLSEVQQQNQELLRLLEELRGRQE